MEVEKAGSFTKAAENLYMKQPHLSKAIKELEESLGCPIFNRTSKGVIPTKKGEDFLARAKSILAQIDEMQSIYKNDTLKSLKFDILVPRASYISYAYTCFLNEIEMPYQIEMSYRETNSLETIKSIDDYNNTLGIIRYPIEFEDYYLSMLAQRNMTYQNIFEFDFKVLMSKYHPLACFHELHYQQLNSSIEIAHGDEQIPSSPVRLEYLNENKKRILIYERGSQLEILSRVPKTHMWVSPMPKDVLERYDLVDKGCKEAGHFKDILIFHKDYHLKELDHLFISYLKEITENLE